MSLTADATLDVNEELDPSAVETVPEEQPTEEYVESEEVTTEPEGEVETEAGDPNTYTVVVDGEEIEVTEEELLQGYSRQRDYTKKTQAIAEERRQLGQARQLAEALDRDPVGTLRILAEAYGISPDESPATDVDEVQERLIRTERFIAEQQRQSQRQSIMQELDGIAEKYGDFDYEEIVQYAVDIGSTDLEAAYLKHQANQKATSERDAERKARAQKALQAKRQARVVEGGNSRRRTDAGLPSRPSFAEALEAAESSIGQRF